MTGEDADENDGTYCNTSEHLILCVGPADVLCMDTSANNFNMQQLMMVLVLVADIVGCMDLLQF